MLYHLLFRLRGVVVGFNVFRYITFRTAFAALTALMISFILGPWLIERMRKIKLGQYIREEGPKSHQVKAGTPTMGGILINVAIIIPTILWADILNPYIWIVLFVTASYAAIGFVDDYRKLAKKQNLGLTAKEKFGAQFVVALFAALAIAYLPMLKNNYSTAITFPFTLEKSRSSLVPTRPIRAWTVPFTLLACTGPPLLVASTPPFTEPASTSPVAPSTLTPPFTDHAPTFTPLGRRTSKSTATSLFRRWPPSSCER